MDNIAEGADQLIALSDRIESEGQSYVGILTNFTDRVFDDMLQIVGNMHDQSVVDVQVHMRHADELIKDWLNTMLQAKKIVKRKGYALRQLGE